MAGRFVFQIASASGMSRSASRLSAHASASARANPPVIPPASSARCLSTFLRSSAEHSQEAKPAYWRGKFAFLEPMPRLDALGYVVRNVLVCSAFGTVCVAPWPSDQPVNGNEALTAPHCSSCTCLSGSSQS